MLTTYILFLCLLLESFTFYGGFQLCLSAYVPVVFIIIFSRHPFENKLLTPVDAHKSGDELYSHIRQFLMFASKKDILSGWFGKIET
jgi:hypothetical protein